MTRRLLKTSSVFIFLSIAASGLNFAFYPVVSHMLSLSQFGDVQVGVSFIMLSAALLTSLSTLALFVSAHKETHSSIINHIERLVIFLSLLIAAITVLFAAPLSTMLQLQDSSLFYLLAGIFLINIPAATWIGALQGNGQFIASGWISVISATAKVVTATIFIILGLGAHGALLGIAIGTLLMLPLVKLFHKNNSITFRGTFTILTRKDIQFFKSNPSVPTVLLALIMFAVISSIDVFWAKASLPPDDAGSYAQLSTAAKIPYFIALPIAIILFERFIRRPNTMTLGTNLRFVGFVGALFIGIVLFSNPLLRIIFNHTSDYSDTVFPLLLASFSLYSVVTLFIYQLIARHRVLAAFTCSSTILLLTVGSLWVSASTATDIAKGYLSALALALLVVLVLSYNVKTHE